MRLVFIGPPGAGKGTQCERLASHYEIRHLSTGLMLRQCRARQTELGKKVGPILDSGQLVDDQTMIELVKECIEEPHCQRGFILDGFPRTIPQADALGGILSARCGLSAAVLLEVDRNELVGRLARRFEELENPRVEDRPEAVPTRLDVYEEQTRPLVNYYEQQNKLIRIDGKGHPESVFDRLIASLQTLS